MNETTKAYMAGIFDGEGSVFIRTRGKDGIPDSIVMTITNSDPRIMKWLKENFGGLINRSIHKGRVGRLPCWVWTVNSRLAVSILREILPYLIIKRDQTEVAIAYSETRKTYRKGLPCEEIAMRKAYKNKIKELKQPPAATTERGDIRIGANDATVCSASKDAEVPETSTRQTNFFHYLN
jgi:hypothetical protein